MFLGEVILCMPIWNNVHVGRRKVNISTSSMLYLYLLKRRPCIVHLLTVNVAKSWTECIFCYDFGWPLKSTSHDMYDILVFSYSVLPLLSPFILKSFSADVRHCPISLTVFDFLMDINEISGNIYIESLVGVYQIKNQGDYILQNHSHLRL